jgi:hypothetical protein
MEDHMLGFLQDDQLLDATFHDIPSHIEPLAIRNNLKLIEIGMNW